MLFWAACVEGSELAYESSLAAPVCIGSQSYRFHFVWILRCYLTPYAVIYTPQPSSISRQESPCDDQGQWPVWVLRGAGQAKTTSSATKKGLAALSPAGPPAMPILLPCGSILSTDRSSAPTAKLNPDRRMSPPCGRAGRPSLSQHTNCGKRQASGAKGFSARSTMAAEHLISSMLTG